MRLYLLFRLEFLIVNHKLRTAIREKPKDYTPRTIAIIQTNWKLDDMAQNGFLDDVGSIAIKDLNTKLKPLLNSSGRRVKVVVEALAKLLLSITFKRKIESYTDIN